MSAGGQGIQVGHLHNTRGGGPIGPPRGAKRSGWGTPLFDQKPSRTNRSGST